MTGWDFSWPDGRATEQRPSWGYQRLTSERLARAEAALDIQTGGGEVLAAAAAFDLVVSRPPRHGLLDGDRPRAGPRRNLRLERLRTEFFDIGAVVYLLRKVIWIVPGFTVEANRDRLRELHDRIQQDGPFIAHPSRFLIEARKPT